MVFNKRGLGAKNFKSINFLINGCPLEICDSYTYLGILFKPSGSFVAAQAELYTKASKAWFSISHVIYQNKKMPVDHSLQLVDSLVMPVGLYTAELLTLCTLPTSAFTNRVSVMKSWENYPLEKINQRACRTILSVHRRASRLACLGELGRYPSLLQGLLLSLKYNWYLGHKADKSNLVYKAYNEMIAISNDTNGSWHSRAQTVQSLMGIELHGGMTPDRVSNIIKKSLKSKFQIFWKNEINDLKIGQDNLPHNKLRFYAQLKSSFTREPYLDNVTNRNQRSWLARLRTSAHSLAIERGRYSNVPLTERVCTYCSDTQPAADTGSDTTTSVTGNTEVDCETHFLARCSRFKIKRQCFLKRLECLIPTVGNMSESDLVKTILCPATRQVAKLVDKFIGIMFKSRADIDLGNDPCIYPTWEPNKPNPFKEYDVDNDDETHHLSDVDPTTYSSDDLDDSLLS